MAWGHHGPGKWGTRGTAQFSGVELTWLTLSSITLQVGFNNSQQRNYFTLPVSRTSDILHLADISNVGILGC